MSPHRFVLRSWLLAAAAIAATALPARAQIPAATDSALQRIFASRYFAGERFGPARWIEDGAAYTTLEKSEAKSGGDDIVRYDTKSGARSVLISAATLVPAGDTTALDIDNYIWSPDASQLMIFTNTKKVWRQNTRGDYWVLNRATGALRQLGGAGAPPSTMMYAKFSPQGDRVAYVRHGDIYVERLTDGAITRLTTGADSLHVNGMSDWVYEEEFGLRDGFRWSPDGTKIAYWHFDMTGVNTFLLINDTDSLYPFVTPIQYPKVGTTNSAVTAGVVSASGGPITWLQLPGDPREDYLPWMEWAGKDSVMVQRLNREQNRDALILASAATGGTRTIMTETDEAWLDVIDEVPWLKGNKEFLWTSERDGWRHTYVVTRATGAVRLVTPGNFDVINIAAVDEKGGWLYYDASPENATQRYLYRTRLDGKGTAQRLTPAGQVGSHRYNIAPDAKYAFHSWSTFNTPGVTELVSLPKHDVARTLVSNTELAAHVAATLDTPSEFFQVTVADGTTLDGWMIKPRDFDPSRKYPILMYVYGEPAGQTVLDSWGGRNRLWHQALADQGYIVASVDNAGTPAPKGRAFRKALYQQIGVITSRHQAEAVQALTRSRPYVDSTRVGIWGWSGGGSSTLQAMFRYPEVYQVGMSVAPVPDQRLYDTIYQERYMGLLGDGAVYDSASPIGQAKGLRGHLLVVHGSGDDNVHYQGTERLMNRLVVLNKSVDFMAYPNRSHCICEGRGTTQHVFTLLTRYLNTWLPAGPRALQNPMP